jgi:hypothetical protein
LESSSASSNGGAIAGGIIGALVAILICVGLLFVVFILYRRRQQGSGGIELAPQNQHLQYDVPVAAYKNGSHMTKVNEKVNLVRVADQEFDELTKLTVELAPANFLTANVPV